MTYRDFNNLSRGTTCDKVLREKALNIAKNPKYDGYQRGIASVVYKCFNKKSSGGNTLGVAVTRTWSDTLATRNKLLLKVKLCQINI